MKERIKRIYELVGKELDCIVLYNSAKPHVDLTFYYVTGLVEGEFEGCAVVIYPDGRAEILTSKLEEESALKAGIPTKTITDRSDREEWLKDKLGGLDSVGVNSMELTHHSYKRIEENTDADLVDVSDGIIEARNVKDGEELRRLRRACHIASKVAEEVPGAIEKGMKEYEVSAEISYSMRKRGASGDAFEIIASSGPNSAEPHYTAGERTLEKGDLLVLDFGCIYKRYCSDITRTYVIEKASSKQKSMHETVLKAQLSSLDTIRAGIKGASAHEAAAKVIDSTEFAGKFTHGLGHSIGLSVHDGSGLSPGVDVTLKPNMVYTVEPGVYLPGYGGVRIEDDIVVTPDGCEELTDAPKGLVVI